MTSWPVCPPCFERDAIPYERLLWSFRPIPVCTTHGCLLVSRCPACNRPLRWDRQDVSRCACGVLLRNTDPVPVSSYGVDLAEQFHRMLLGKSIPPSQMSPAACFWWAGRMAAAVAETPTWLDQLGKRVGVEASTCLDAAAWFAAAEILVDWPHRLADPERCLNGIVVSQTDLVSLVPKVRNRRDQVRGYPVHQLAKILFPGRPVKPTVLTKWIAAGLLKARKIGRARIVSSEEVQRFRSEYCLADEACRLLAISRSTLSRWEVEGRIRPVYGKRVNPGAGFSLYRREDLLKLSRRRSPLARKAA